MKNRVFINIFCRFQFAWITINIYFKLSFILYAQCKFQQIQQLTLIVSQHKIMILKIAYKSQIRIFNPKEDHRLQTLHEFITKNFKKLDKYALYYEDEEGDNINLDTQDDFQIYLEQEKRSKIFIRAEAQENKENKFEHLDQSQKSQNAEIPLIKQQQKVEESVDIEEKMEEIVRKIEEMILDNSEIKQEEVMQKKDEEEIVQEKVIHNVMCDQCKSDNIIGIRYKCAVCQDFDLCSSCQALANHHHPMIKIREPFQAPLICKLTFQKPLEPIYIPIVQQKPKTKVQFQSVDERRMIVISYLQDLLGQNKDAKYDEFAKSYLPIYEQDILDDYMKWKNQVSERTLPKFFKWIKSGLNLIIDPFARFEQRRNE